jgi:hypothetical protein
VNLDGTAPSTEALEQIDRILGHVEAMVVVVGNPPDGKSPMFLNDSGAISVGFPVPPCESLPDAMATNLIARFKSLYQLAYERIKKIAVTFCTSNTQVSRPYSNHVSSS